MEKLTIKRSHKASLAARKARSGYFFVAPFVLGFILIYLPILFDSIRLSFLVGTGSNSEFVGFDNFGYALSVSPKYVSTIFTGLQELVIEVPSVLIFSLFIAVVLNQKMLGRAAFRAIFFVPVIISTGLMVDLVGSIGDVSASAAETGTGQGIANFAAIESMFAGNDMVGFVVGLVKQIYEIINYSGVQMLIFLAGLQSISESIYEACRIDGATGWETFWKVTFPMISPMILVNAVYTMIDSFTRETNPMMQFIQTQDNTNYVQAMYWFYFLVVIILIAAVVAVISSFVFYQRRD